MPNYRVIAEFVDLETGQRRYPGETIEVTLAARAKRMVEKSVIDPEPLPESPAEKARGVKPEANEDAGEPKALGDGEAGEFEPANRPRRARGKAK